MPRLSLAKAFMAAMEAVDKKVHWHRVPGPLGLLTLIGIRDQLRARNLYDTGSPAGNGRDAPRWNPRYLSARSIDGTYNDLQNPGSSWCATTRGFSIPGPTRARWRATVYQPIPKILRAGIT